MLGTFSKSRAAADALQAGLVRWHADVAVCDKIDRFGAFWRDLAAAKGRVPTRRDFDPAEIPNLLPNLLLIEARRASGGNRVRLAGTCVAAAMETDVTGCDLQSLPHEGGARVLAAVTELCLAQQRPIPGEFALAAYDAVHGARAFAGFRILAAPLAATETTPPMALVLAVFVAFGGSEIVPQWLGMPAVV
jgi:hypothetical protein